MSIHATWNPTGTTRARFEKTRGLPTSEFEGLIESIRLRRPELPRPIFDLARAVTRGANDLSEPESEALFVVALAAYAGLLEGSTRVPLGDTIRQLLRDWCPERWSRAPNIELFIDRLSTGDLDPRLANVIGMPVKDEASPFKPLVIDQGCLYPERMYRAEVSFANAVGERIAAPRRGLAPEQIHAALADVLARPSRASRGLVTLSAEQEDAVRRAVDAPFLVISGGPGTGKTSIVVAIARVLARLDRTPESLAISAPTGKAAHRLVESLRSSLESIEAPSETDLALLARLPRSETLHRLLGYSPGRDRFTRDEKNPIRASVVIVDEASMIDLSMMERLSRAVRKDAQLILLGDAEQLPSVDAGTVLRDLSIAAENMPSFAASLRESFRMDPKDVAGRHILSVAINLRAGRVSYAANEAQEGAIIARQTRDLRFRGVEWVETPPPPETTAFVRNINPSLREFVKSWYLRRFSDNATHASLSDGVFVTVGGAFVGPHETRVHALFAQLDPFKILCVTRAGALSTSAEAINALIRGHFASDAAIAGKTIGRYFPGEPVIVLRNDYHRRLFNGDQGVIVFVQEGEGSPQPTAVFRAEGGFVTFHAESLGDLIAPAHAITVHKSQGSEFDEIALILPEKPMPLVTREVLYTALTRSRRSAIILGPRNVLEHGVRNQIRRFSGVAPRLAEAIGHSQTLL